MAKVISTEFLDATINDAEIRAACLDAFREANESLELSFSKEFTRNKWQWPTGKSPRDIIDSGDLRRSYVPTPGPESWLHAWTMDYAVPVHEGAKGAKFTMPARPWTKAPLDRLQSVYSVFAKTRLDKIP